ncbi:NUDIX hydrolase [Streptomyces sp. 372A]
MGLLATKPPVASPEENPRLCVEILARRGGGDVLMVQTLQGQYTLPGGGVRAGESAPEAARRELREETGVVRKVSRILAIDQSGPEGDCLSLVFDGGMLTPDDAASVTLPPEGMDEILGFAWIPPERLHQYATAEHTARIDEALLALRAGNRLPALWQGHQASA